MNKDKHPLIDFDRIAQLPNLDYTDGDIAIHSDIRELLKKKRLPIALNAYTVAVCRQGRLQITLDDVQYDISERTLLLMPDEIIRDCVVSPDFDGGLMCMSQRIIVDSFSCNDFWDIGLELADCRTATAGEELLPVFHHYSTLLLMKIKSDNTLFRKEILQSLVKATIYELLAVQKKDSPAVGRGLIRQREVLFRRFITLLTGEKVKPRNLAWYAGCLCVSPKHLSSVCKAVSGKTAFEWISDYVLSDIRRLLRNSSKSIKEIANYLEFPSLSFFAKYVKRHTGMSPTDYRRELRNLRPDGEHDDII